MQIHILHPRSQERNIIGNHDSAFANFAKRFSSEYLSTQYTLLKQFRDDNPTEFPTCLVWIANFGDTAIDSCLMLGQMLCQKFFVNVNYIQSGLNSNVFFFNYYYLIKFLFYVIQLRSIMWKPQGNSFNKNKQKQLVKEVGKKYKQSIVQADAINVPLSCQSLIPDRLHSPAREPVEESHFR